MYNFELLKSLYEIHSPSNGEKKLRKFVKRFAARLGCVVRQDVVGNVYITKGEADTYPCICAHLDQVQKQHSKDFTVYAQGDIIFAYSAKSKSQQGLGADDKNGVWIALELLEQLDVLKCAFFVGEEIGCVGSSAADMTFFKDVRYCIQPDRRNGDDLITAISGEICSREFLTDIDYERFGYKETTGLMTDVETLCENGVGVSCINISCGYYNPHTDHECTSWSELCNALDFAHHICTTLTDVYPHKYESIYSACGSKYGGGYWGSRGGYGSYGTGSYYDDYYWDDEEKKYKPTSEKKSVKKDAALLDDVNDDEDYDAMYTILDYEPHLTFEEVVRNYGTFFYSRDMDFLRCVYEDTKGIIEEKYFGKNTQEYDVVDEIDSCAECG